MRQAINTRPVTIYLTEADFKEVKQITDDKMISIAQWFRQATQLKLEQDKDNTNDR
jgi:hypothetical protein